MEDLEKGFPSSRSATADGNQHKTEVRRKKPFESKTFQAYKLQILWKPIRYHHLLSGSFFELPGHYVLANLTDTDRMRVYASRQAVPYDAKLPENITRQTLFIDAQESPVGFCRLRCPKENRFFTRGQTGLHGPARKMLLSDWLDIGCKLNDGVSALLGFRQLTLDQVDAVFCPNWPSEATDWKTRTSLSGWPDKYLKDHILRGGCHLVAKSHHTEPNDDTLWRYSFSQAEIILIGSWNDVQKYIYHILRVIKGRVTKECKTSENSIFSSYLFKTLMLWACEKKAVEFWSEECIESSIAELLCEAIECLIDRECQHYFMPEVNILDQPTESDTIKEVSSLEERMRSEIQSTMRLFPKFNERTSFQVEINKNFVAHYKLRANTEYVINPFSSSFERYFDNELENDPIFRSELESLHEGMLANLELRSSKSVMRRVEYEETVNECFRVCLSENSLNLFGAIINSNESFHMAANRIFNVDLCKARILPQKSGCLSQTYTDAETTKTAGKKLQLSPNETEVGPISNEGSGMLSKIVKTTTNGRTCCYVRTPREWKGYSANLSNRTPISFANVILRKISDLYKKPCYLISRAYYANYYYTYHKNYQLALHLCTETLEYIEKFHNCSELQTRMHEDIFPVILSSSWMPLFDENIQVVFAFSILTIAIGYSNGIPLTSCYWIPPSSSNKVLESHSVYNLHSVMRPLPPGLETAQRRKRCQQLLSSVVLQVSAVEFMRYIGVQCLKQLSLGVDSLFDMSARQPSERRLVQQSLLLLAAVSFELPNSKL